MKKIEIQNSDRGSGFPNALFILVAAALVTAGLTILFQKNADQIDRLRFENKTSKVAAAIFNRLGPGNNGSISGSFKTGKNVENEGVSPGIIELSEENGVIIKRLPSNLPREQKLKPESLDSGELLNSARSGSTKTFLVQLQGPAIKRNDALIFLSPTAFDPSRREVEGSQEFEFVAVSLKELASIVDRNGGGEINVEFKTPSGPVRVPDVDEEGIEYDNSGHRKSITLNDGSTLFEMIPAEEFHAESASRLTILIPLSGTIVGVLVFALVLLQRRSLNDLASLARDLDDARKKNAALLISEREARLEAENSNRAKDEFLSTISHEIRTPLNAISGWTQILEKRKPSGTLLEEALSTIKRNITKQSDIVNELLLFSRLSGGQTELAKDIIPARKLADEIAEEVKPEAAKRNINLTICNELAGEKIYCDKKKLKTALRRVFDNAFKYTPAGGEVSFVAKKSGSLIIFEISDTGRGIESDVLPLVFEEFRQADSSTTRQFGGLGLGLAIAKKITELHGGSIEATSAGSNCGSSFEISLPMMPSEISRHKSSPYLEKAKQL